MDKQENKQSSVGVGIGLSVGQIIVLVVIFSVVRTIYHHPVEGLAVLGAIVILVALVVVNRRYLGPWLEWWEIGDDDHYGY